MRPAEAGDGAVPLGDLLRGALAVGEHHRAKGGRDEQCTGRLEGEHVAGEDQVGQARHVAALVRGVQPAVDGRHVADAEDEQPGEPQGRQQGSDPLPPKRLHQGVGGVDADQHEDEQEQHHHGTGVDHDLHDTEERRILRQVHHREAQHRHGQQQRTVDGLLHEQHARGRDHRQRSQQPEDHRFAGPGVGGGCAHQRRRGRHSVSPRSAAAAAARAAT
jgi:hypothetical protein